MLPPGGEKHEYTITAAYADKSATGGASHWTRASSSRTATCNLTARHSERMQKACTRKCVHLVHNVKLQGSLTVRSSAPMTPSTALFNASMYIFRLKPDTQSAARSSACLRVLLVLACRNQARETKKMTQVLRRRISLSKLRATAAIPGAAASACAPVDSAPAGAASCTQTWPSWHAERKAQKCCQRADS